MPWLYLVLAGLLEIGWPLGLKLGWQSGTLRALPIIGAAVSMVGSGAFLFLAQRTIPIGTAYAVWTGIGSVGTFIVGVLVFGEQAQAARIASVLLIVSGIVGLKVFSSH